MRQILFRGKRVDNSEWVGGSLYYDPDLEQSQIYGFDYTYNNQTGEERECFHRLVDSNTVGQYTGLTDKNGKKIFEGDIVKSDNGHISYVVFHYGSFALKCKCHNSINMLYGDNETIIGNIHDNPKILKGE